MSSTTTRTGTRAAAVALAGIASWGLAVPAAVADQVVDVRPGDSIQRAVDRAEPGATVRVHAGTYRQHVLITKSLTLVAQGRVVLRAPATVVPNQCTEQVSDESSSPADVGICVEGSLGGRDPFGELIVLAPVRDVRVSGIEIAGFTEGFLAYGTAGLQVSDVTARDSGDVGLFSGAGRGTVISRVTAVGNHSSGLRVDTSQNVQVLGSTSRDNGWGVGINEVTGGVIAGNKVSGNCVGMLAFDTSEPAPTGDLDIRDNQVTGNSAFCPADGGPALSGIGLALIGTTDVHVHDNTISRNVQTGSPDLGGAGVLLLDATELTGGSLPIGNVIEGNVLTRNSPAQVVWDGTGLGNTIRDNRCTPSCS